ncbi:outer membrane lipoprotein-sorting protein [Ralstonia pseudosolanacearum]|uniref:outer membrane lipoprotein-sorting protein n=1 Tax=Ralstonia pseudosolanacearum TaxID=1310165 RepID=UPI001FF79D05|nr:outer membrane lipoprotein-sorting protein [Ralstonia pseudosolanacearum]
MLGALTAPGLLALPRYANAVPKNADDIVAAVERLLDPAPAYRMVNTIVQYENGNEISRIKVAVFTKRQQSSGKWLDIVQYVDPPRDSGKTLLNDGDALWFYDPASRASLRISMQQRLLGQASNGDVLTINYSRDYRARQTGEATVNDADKQKHDCNVVEFTAATEAAVYGRLEYWIDKATNAIIKGKCYADSGQLLKLVYYRDQKPALGGVRPMQAVLIDAVNTRLVTTMNFSDFRTIDIPDAWFHRSYLPRIDAS